MNLFYRRPLSLILCIMLGGFSVFTVLPEAIKPYSLLILIPLLLVLTVRRLRRTLTIVAFTALLISLLCSHLYFDCWFRVYERFPDEVEITATVTDVDRPLFYSTTLSLKTESINGEPFTASYRLRAKVSPESASYISKGKVVRFTCILKEFESSSDFDANAYYTAMGISANADITSAIEVTGERFILDFSYLRELISRRITMLSGAEAGSLFTALFTGNREGLSGILRLNFTRIGISHVLALSGMHLAILSALTSKMFKLLRIGRKYNLAITSLLILFYMAMTGFSPSVTRAGIMLILTGTLFLLASSRDTVTALSFAVFVICLFEPYSIYDLGLWLSAFATLGVLEAGALDKQKYNSWQHTSPTFGKRILKKLLLVIVVTLFAVSATLTISVFSFSGISSVSPLSSPIFSFLAEIYIYVGLLALAFGNILPFGSLLRPLYRAIFETASLFSQSELAYFSDEFPVIEFASVILAVLLALFLILNLKHKKIAASLISLFLIAIVTFSGILTQTARYDDKVIYYSGDKCEFLLIRSEGKRALVDFSSGTAISVYDASDALSDSSTVILDKLIFCYYSANLPEKAQGMCVSILTKEVLLPLPQNEDEKSIAALTEEALSETDVKITYYGATGVVKIGKHSLSKKFRTLYTEQTAMSVMTLTSSDSSIVYLSSGVLYDKNGKNYAAEALSSSDCVIFGKGGKKYKETYIFKEKHPQIQQIVFSVTNLRFTQNTRIYYDEIGAELYLRPKRAELTP